MNLIELQRSLRQLRLGGMAAVLETRLHQAQAEPMAPLDLLATLVHDELTRRSDRLLERRRKQAGFRDPDKTLDNFDFQFNPKLNRSSCSILLPAVSSTAARMPCFSGPAGPARAILLRPSVKRPFCKATRCSTAKLEWFANPA
jgi:DNA replication protein DnaC